MARLHGAVARLRDGAHGGEGDLRGRGQGAVDEALENWTAGACGWGEADVDVGNKGRCCVCDEDERDEAAKGNWRKLAIFRY
jgi:hypothetical protein